MRIRIPFIVLSVVLTVVSCSKSGTDGPDKKDTDNSKVYEEVTFNSDRKTIRKNPLCGWVMYAPLVDDPDKLWKTYDSFHSSAGEIKVSDYATVLYIRGPWSDFEPEEGVYIWDKGVNTPKAQSLRKLTEGAAERGMKLAFTLTTDSRDKHQFCTPEYVRNKIIEKYGSDTVGGFWTKTGSMDVWSPYPDNPVFQECYERFIKAMAKEYNDPSRVEFISGLGMGKWGEYHTCVYSTGDETPREAVFDWVTDLYVNAFDRIPVFTNYHKNVGSTKGSGSKDPLSAVLLNRAIEKGFSMRHDAFGMKADYGYGTWERNFIANWRFKVPVLGEGGWVQGQHDFSSDYPDVRSLREGEFAEMQGAYVNMMDLRYSENIEKGETYSWFNDAFDLVRQFSEEGCYKVLPDKVTFPVKIVNGKTYTLRHRWVNVGHAYCPTNIKQYKDRFAVAFAILDRNTGKVVKTAGGYALYYDDNAHLHDLTGGRLSYEMSFSPEGIPAGDYDFAVGVVDKYLSNEKSGDFKIGIYLSAAGEYTDGGWLKIKQISVQ